MYLEISAELACLRLPMTTCGAALGLWSWIAWNLERDSTARVHADCHAWMPKSACSGNTMPKAGLLSAEESLVVGQGCKELLAASDNQLGEDSVTRGQWSIPEVLQCVHLAWQGKSAAKADYEWKSPTSTRKTLQPCLSDTVKVRGAAVCADTRYVQMAGETEILGDNAWGLLWSRQGFTRQPNTLDKNKHRNLHVALMLVVTSAYRLSHGRLDSCVCHTEEVKHGTNWVTTRIIWLRTEPDLAIELARKKWPTVLFTENLHQFLKSLKHFLNRWERKAAAMQRNWNLLHNSPYQHATLPSGLIWRDSCSQGPGLHRGHQLWPWKSQPME